MIHVSSGFDNATNKDKNKPVVPKKSKFFVKSINIVAENSLPLEPVSALKTGKVKFDH
jgi:hypothetical protein